MESLVVDLSDGFPFTFGPTKYQVDPWDIENNPGLMFWAKANNDPVALIKSIVDDPAEPQELKNEISWVLNKDREMRMKSIYAITLRHVAIARYGFAVADKKALDLIKKHSHDGVVEIGAGCGYLAMLLERVDVRVSAYDSFTGKYRNTFKFGAHAKVEKSRHSNALADGAHKEKTLLMSWPDYAVSWPGEALSLYKGNTVAYIGEGDGGCTGDDKFHRILSKKWECVEEHSIPVWWGVHDRLEVYKRKGGGK
jgi:hypothetical protein